MTTCFDNTMVAFKSKDYTLYANGSEVFVYYSDVASFAVITGDEALVIDIEALFPFQNVKVRPLSCGIAATTSGVHVNFSCQAPAKLSVEFDDGLLNPLFLFIYQPETNKPSPSDPSVRYYKSGQIYDEGLIELSDGQTLYIEEGAVVYGSVIALNSTNISIGGRGILNGQKWQRPVDFDGDTMQMVNFADCCKVTIKDIILFDGPTWHINLVHCVDVAVSNISIISMRITGDGIDIVGSSHVKVSGYFARTNDDCIAIKGTGYQYESGCNNVHDVIIENSVFWNARYGNALEIGFETRCETISDIIFRNCDIIHCEFEGHEAGGTLTIHNGDRALITNVLYDDIRIENSEQKLIDFKVLKSMYSQDEERGYIKHIKLKNIKIVDGKFPPSIIRGYHPSHLIENIQIENLVAFGQKINNLCDARIITELSTNIQII